MADLVKPPLGLRMRKFALEERQREVLDAIKRYQDAEMQIPVEWTQERDQLDWELRDAREDRLSISIPNPHAPNSEVRDTIRLHWALAHMLAIFGASVHPKQRTAILEMLKVQDDGTVL